MRQAVEVAADAGSEPALPIAAQRVLAAYDYAHATVLLSRLRGDDASGGPFLVSRQAASLGDAPQRLFFDMSRVAPALVWDWTRSYCWLAAEDRSWSAAALQRFALNLRNAIAVAAHQPAALADALSGRVWLERVH